MDIRQIFPKENYNSIYKFLSIRNIYAPDPIKMGTKSHVTETLLIITAQHPYLKEVTELGAVSTATSGHEYIIFLHSRTMIDR